MCSVHEMMKSQKSHKVNKNKLKFIFCCVSYKYKTLAHTLSEPY